MDSGLDSHSPLYPFSYLLVIAALIALLFDLNPSVDLRLLIRGLVGFAVLLVAIGNVWSIVRRPSKATATLRISSSERISFYGPTRRDVLAQVRDFCRRDGARVGP